MYLLQEKKTMDELGECKNEFLYQFDECGLNVEEESDESDAEELMKLEEITSNTFHDHSHQQKTSSEEFNLPQSVAITVDCLNEDEQQWINSCNDPQVKKLMMLNRTKNMHLLRFYHKISLLLQETQKLIQRQYNNLKSNNSLMLMKPPLCKLGTPYFKTRDLFLCPPNDDVHRKLENGELLTFKPFHRWLLTNQISLKYAVSLSYQKNSELTGEMDNGGDLLPALGEEDKVDWIRVSEELKGKFSPTACKAYWSQHLHPSINKSNWTETENEEIKKLAKIHNQQNWEIIASALKTNRTAYSVCSHYFSKLKERYRKDKFEKAEDDLLLEVIQISRIGSYIPWAKVSYYFPTRSKVQLFNRYKYFLSDEGDPNKTFTVEEDAAVIFWVKKLGKNYCQVANHLPGRSAMQVKGRYCEYLSSEFVYGPWSLEEDRLILEHGDAFGNTDWNSISQQLRRRRITTRKRYEYLKKRLQKDPILSNIPRRKDDFNKKQTDHMSEVWKLVNTYEETNTVPELPDRPVKPKRSKGKAHEKLIDFFKSSYKMPNSSVQNVSQSATVIKNLLNFFDAKLEYDLTDVLDSSDLTLLDVALLSHLKRNDVNNCDKTLNHKESMLPPNIETVVGLRGLILRHSQTKNRMPATNCNNKNGVCLTAEEKVFQKRFQSIFVWPSILSLIAPNDSLTKVCNPKIKPPRPIGRPRNYAKKHLDKIARMNEAKRRKLVNVHEEEEASSTKRKRKIEVNCRNGKRRKLSCEEVKDDASEEKVVCDSEDDDQKDIELLDSIISQECQNS